MKFKKLSIWVFIYFLFIQVGAQDDVPLFNYWQYYSDIENSLYKHFCSVAADQIEARKEKSKSLKQKRNGWKSNLQFIRNCQILLAPFLEKHH